MSVQGFSQPFGIDAINSIAPWDSQVAAYTIEMDVAAVPLPSWSTLQIGLGTPFTIQVFKAPPGFSLPSMVPADLQADEKGDNENVDTASGSQSGPDVEPSHNSSECLAQLPSKGSAGHGLGHCKPCHYAPSKAGCAQAQECIFCHFRHQKRNRQHVPRSERHKCLVLSQAVHDAGFKGEHQLAIAESRLAEFLMAHPQLDNYVAAVLRSLRCGALLQGIGASI